MAVRDEFPSPVIKSKFSVCGRVVSDVSSFSVVGAVTDSFVGADGSEVAGGSVSPEQAVSARNKTNIGILTKTERSSFNCITPYEFNGQYVITHENVWKPYDCPFPLHSIPEQYSMSKTKKVAIMATFYEN
ncbi:hypothetical protein [Paenibacillus taichungensis]|uniref:hypothetical protein n=1 Tax=Paenibacillus taichungensis TaxID=484184 RepID=UPI00215B9C0D|nr:hypothetical protein [Paenibacillus taichungensis]